jgi:hypothetical protein
LLGAYAAAGFTRLWCYCRRHRPGQPDADLIVHRNSRVHANFNADRKSVRNCISKVACGRTARQARKQMTVIDEHRSCFAGSFFVKESATNNRFIGWLKRSLRRDPVPPGQPFCILGGGN